MKAALIFILLVAGGCTQNAPPPVPSSNGLATLRVHVIAEPKAGAPRTGTAVSSFDPPAARASAEFAKVDYTDLSQIVVWAQPTSGGMQKQSTVLPQLTLPLNQPAPVDSVTAVASVGQQIGLRNGTSSPQRFYSVSDGNDFNLGTLQPGATSTFGVRAPGAIEVLSESDSEPLAVIEAAATPFIKMAHAGDDLTFINLPPGDYRVISWHPRLPGSETIVHLHADQTADAQVRVGVNALPKVAAP